MDGIPIVWATWVKQESIREQYISPTSPCRKPFFFGPGLICSSRWKKDEYASSCA